MMKPITVATDREQLSTVLASEKTLAELVGSLVDLLDEVYEAYESRDTLVLIEITGGQMYRLESPYCDSLLIELPPGLDEYPRLAAMVATLLQRSGSDAHWNDEANSEPDPYRSPLRFSFVKKTIWIPSNNCFSEGGHLMVDAIDFDPEAAEEQVALLVDYLKDDANLVELTPDLARLF